MGIFSFLKNRERKPEGNASTVSGNGNQGSDDSGKNRHTNGPSPAGGGSVCCFCGRKMRSCDIRYINKPGYENRPDPHWFYCEACERISKEDITRLKQFDGYNQYAYKSLEKDIKNQNFNRACEKTKEFSTFMTSQLAALWLNTKDEKYKAEYLRRIALCGLDQAKADRMLDFECGIITAFPRPELLQDHFVSLPLLNLREPFLKNSFEYYQTHFEYPLSYIVKLSDEGERHFWYSHERDLPDKVWEEIFMLSDKQMALFRPFAMNLIDNMGWTVQNVNRFSYFEQKILNVFRWKITTPENAGIWVE